MIVTVEAAVRPRRNGYEAQASEIGLCGHGPDGDTALESLHRGAEAWATALARAGALERAARRHGVALYEPESPAVEVKVTVRNTNDVA